jgi:Tfp pilus assembly protein PilX
MSFLEAAETVLRSAEEPLTAAEITGTALRRGLVKTRGKTPAATMSAALYGAPPDSPIRREFTPGRQRAVRDSVGWTYDPRAR